MAATLNAIGPGDFVRVTYNGRTRRDRDGNDYYDKETPYTFMWDSKPYVVQVGQEGFVPFEAMMLACGDPRSTSDTATVRDAAGNVMWVVDRPTEVRRLRVLYDNRVGEEGEILYAPDATVTDLDGNPIKTVLDDPDGESVLPAQTTLLDREQLLAQVQRQQRMIEQLAEAQGVDLATGEPSPIVEEPVANDKDPFASVPEG